MKRSSLDNAFCCNDMLFLPSMKGSKVLAGKNSLRKPITKVNTLEMPDIADWLKGGEFLITTAFAFKENVDSLMEQIPIYKAKKVRGIAIKPKRFIEITEELIATCNEYNFPLIQLPMEAIFADIVKESIQAISKKEYQTLALDQEMTGEMIQLIYKDTPIEDVLLFLQKRLGRKVFIVNYDYIISCDPIVTSHQQFIADNQELLNTTQTNTVRINGTEMKAFLYHLPDCENCAIVTLSPEAPFEEIDLFILSKLCTILSVEIKNFNARRQMRNTYQNRFLRAWLSGNFTTANDIFINSKSYGLSMDIDHRHCVAIVDTVDPQHHFTSDSIDVDRIRHNLTQITKSFSITFYNHLCVIFHFHPTETNLDATISHIHNQIQGIVKQDIQFFVSNDYPPEALPDAYREAHNIFHIGQKCNIPGNCVRYENLGIFTILSQVSNNDTTHQFIQRTLSPLLSYDEAHNTKLYETLISYYSLNCNAKLTAKTNFSHYHTILYRLNRIKEILDTDIDDPEMKLQLQIAIKLYSILQDLRV